MAQILLHSATMTSSQNRCTRDYRPIMTAQSLTAAAQLRRIYQKIAHPDKGGSVVEAAELNKCYDIRRRNGPIHLRTAHRVFYERTKLRPSAEISSFLSHIPQNELGEISKEDIWIDPIVAKALGRPVHFEYQVSTVKDDFSPLYSIFEQVNVCNLEDEPAHRLVITFANHDEFHATIRIRLSAASPCPFLLTDGRVRDCNYTFFTGRGPVNQCVTLRLHHTPHTPHNVDHFIHITKTTAIVCMTFGVIGITRIWLRGLNRKLCKTSCRGSL